MQMCIIKRRKTDHLRNYTNGPALAVVLRQGMTHTSPHSLKWEINTRSNPTEKNRDCRQTSVCRLLSTHEQYSVHDLLEFVVEADKCGFGATMASNHVSAVRCGI